MCLIRRQFYNQFEYDDIEYENSEIKSNNNVYDIDDDDDFCSIFFKMFDSFFLFFCCLQTEI